MKHLARTPKRNRRKEHKERKKRNHEGWPAENCFSFHSAPIGPSFFAFLCVLCGQLRSSSLVLFLLTPQLALAAGGPGAALNFNGGGNYVSVPHAAALNAYPLTVTAWIKTSQTTGFAALVHKIDFGVFSGYQVSMQNGSLYAFYMKDGTAYVNDFVDGVNGGFVADGAWHHIALVVDAAGGRLYVDGVLKDSLAWLGGGTPGPPITTRAMLMGDDPASSFRYFGLMDEVTVWNVALTPAQILANKNRSLAGTEAGLVAYYRCDGGTLAADSAPAGGNNEGSWTISAAYIASDLRPFSPGAETVSAALLTETSAALNGMAHPGGTNTSAWFQWGTTTNYGNTTSPQAVGSGTSNTNFNRLVSGLASGVTHHFRTVASNALGVAFGTNQSFVPTLFADIGAGLPGIIRPPGYVGYWQRSAAWGDYDNDGRLDIALSATNFVITIWRNTGAGFSFALGVPFGYSPLCWTDFNHDGRLDLAMNGYLLGNTNGGFDLTSVPFALPAGYELAGGWPVLQDFNNDGRRDYLLSTFLFETSSTQFKRATLLSLNGSDGFFPMTNHPVGAAGPLAWGDFDNDGRADVAVTGFTDQPGGSLAEIWRNTGNGFVNLQSGLPGVVNGSVAWGDYDNDGRLDLLLTGMTNNVATPISQVWRNTGGGFSNIQAGLPGVSVGSGEWGDYDNDGRLDILLVGKTNLTTQTGGTICQLWRNTGAGFVRVPDFGMPGLCGGTAAWGDYDNDGRLDILLVGYTNWFANLPQARFYPTGAVSQVWRNFTSLANTPPNAPGGLSVSLSNQTATFTWNVATDAQTPAAALSYNLRVGTTPGGSEIVSALALPSGRLQAPEFGNAGLRRSRSITSLPFGTPLYWSVQAVDTSFAGSAFAPEQTATIYTTLTPPGGSTNNVPGDTNGDGLVSGAELNAVLANYFSTSPWLQMTNVAGLGGTNVTFALTNDIAGAFSVEYTTDFANWLFLGLATPRYLFTDTNAPTVPQRYYRLRWP